MPSTSLKPSTASASTSASTPRKLRADRNAERRAAITKNALRVVSPRRGWAQVFYAEKYLALHRVAPFRHNRAEVLVVSGPMEGCEARVLNVDDHTTLLTRQSQAGTVTLATIEYTTGLGYTKSASFESIGMHPVQELMVILKGVGRNPPKPP